MCSSDLTMIQCIMVGILIAFPGLVTSSLEKSTVDPTKVIMDIQPTDGGSPGQQDEAPPDFGTPAGK